MLPVDKMRLTDLIQKTTNEIPCPYDIMNFLQNANEQSGNVDQSGKQFFYDMNTYDNNDGRHKGKRHGGRDNQANKRHRPMFDQGELFMRRIDGLQ